MDPADFDNLNSVNSEVVAELDASSKIAAEQALREILASKTAPAAARATAARTLLELTGAIGRHAESPADRGADSFTMSRWQLEARLAEIERERGETQHQPGASPRGF